MCGKKYTISKFDPCVYYNKLSGGEYIYLLLYVDDMLIAFKSRSTIDRLKKQLSSEFERKDLSEENKVFGIEIVRDRHTGKVCLTQMGYLQKVLQKFNINGDTKSISTLLAPHFKLRAIMSLTTVEEREYMSHIPCASTVGSLMYAMVCPRPDLSQAISMLSRYMHDFGKVFGRR